MNGYGIEYGSSNSCDLLRGKQQRRDLEPVKSQITEKGIIPEDARREEYCNIPQYDGTYQNYPQLHLGHNIQQCELMLRRGDSSCFDNVDTTDIPEYTFTGPDGEHRTTHLYPGRGSISGPIKPLLSIRAQSGVMTLPCTWRIDITSRTPRSRPRPFYLPGKKMTDPVIEFFQGDARSRM